MQEFILCFQGTITVTLESRFEDQHPLATSRRSLTPWRLAIKKGQILTLLYLVILNRVAKVYSLLILGFPEDSDWVLYGPEHDKSLGLRNVLTYELAQSLTSFAPKTKFVEVFVIGDGRPLNMDHYNGLYVFTEKIKRDKHRVDISKRSEQDITGNFNTQAIVKINYCTVRWLYLQT